MDCARYTLDTPLPAKASESPACQQVAVTFELFGPFTYAADFAWAVAAKGHEGSGTGEARNASWERGFRGFQAEGFFGPYAQAGSHTERLCLLAGEHMLRHECGCPGIVLGQRFAKFFLEGARVYDESGYNQYVHFDVIKDEEHGGTVLLIVGECADWTEVDSGAQAPLGANWP
jgi:hypothetical protein